jgi:hypothetical protein
VLVSHITEKSVDDGSDDVNVPDSEVLLDVSRLHQENELLRKALKVKDGQLSKAVALLREIYDQM